MLFLQSFELAHEAVVLGIGDGRLVQHVIKVLVVPDGFSQMLNLRSEFLAVLHSCFFSE